MGETNVNIISVDANGIKIAGDVVTATAAELNAIAGSGITAADAAKLAAITASAAEINSLTASGILPADMVKLADLTASAVQINALPNLQNAADQTFLLAAAQWEDLRFPAAGINPAGSAAPPTVDTATGRLSFAPGAINVIAFQAQMPHAWLEGSSIEVHVHWSPSNTDNKRVLWRFEYKVANIGETFPGAFTPIDTLDNADGIADKHQLHDIGMIAMVGKTLSCMLLCKLTRVGTDATDDFTGDALLCEIDFHHQVNTLGSRQETIK